MKTVSFAFYLIVYVMFDFSHVESDELEALQEFKTEIKSNILKQLHMAKKPSVENNDLVYPKPFTDHSFDKENKEKIKVIFTAEKGDATSSIRFKTQSTAITPTSRIESSRLSVYKMSIHNAINLITIYLKQGSTIISSVSVAGVYEGWVNFDITITTTPMWLRETNVDMKSFSLSCEHKGLKIRKKDEYAPYIIINVVKNKTALRQRRSIACTTNSHCCGIPTYVNFKDDSWRFVVSPPGFWTNRCVGTCVSGDNQCCVPTVLHTITMFYRDVDNILYGKELKNIATDECGCI